MNEFIVKNIYLLIQSGILLGIISIIFRFGKFSEKINKIENDIKELKDSVKSIDQRTSRLEGILFWMEKMFFEKKVESEK